MRAHVDCLWPRLFSSTFQFAIPRSLSFLFLINIWWMYFSGSSAQAWPAMHFFFLFFLIQWPAKQSRSDLAVVPLAQLAHNAAAKSDVQTAAGKVECFLCVKNWLEFPIAVSHFIIFLITESVLKSTYWALKLHPFPVTTDFKWGNDLLRCGK